MKKVFIIVNIFLLFLIFFEGWQFLKVWSAESALSFIKQGAVSLPVLPTTEGRGRGKSDKKNDSLREGMVLSETSFEKEGEKLLPLNEFFAGVIEKNLFHTQRREGAEEIKVESQTSPLSKPKAKPIIMEGIVIIGNYKAVIIKDTVPHVKGGRLTRRVRIGDTIEDQKVIAIMEDRIVVKDEEGERVIKMHDSDRPLRPQITENTGGAPAQMVPLEIPLLSPPPAS